MNFTRFTSFYFIFLCSNSLFFCSFIFIFCTTISLFCLFLFTCLFVFFVYSLFLKCWHVFLSLFSVSFLLLNVSICIINSSITNSCRPVRNVSLSLRIQWRLIFADAIHCSRPRLWVGYFFSFSLHLCSFIWCF